MQTFHLLHIQILSSEICDDGITDGAERSELHFSIATLEAVLF